ncbi:MAG: hypothetical protein V3U92_03385 [Cellulophaga sp.]
MKTSIILIISLLYLNGYSQKTHDKKNANKDWKAIIRVMFDLRKNCKEETKSRLLIYNDSLLQKAAQLLETFWENYPKDKRCKCDYKLFPSNLGGLYILPQIGKRQRKAPH